MTRLVIAGAGISGLTCALTLHAAGYTNLVVMERARTVAPLGVRELRAGARGTGTGPGPGVLPELTAIRGVNRTSGLRDLVGLGYPAPE